MGAERRGDVGGRFEGKVALVTGAGSGIGRATTERLVTEGAPVLAVDVDEDALAETVSAVNGPIEAFVADLADPDRCPEAVTTAVERFGRLDVLANVAGVLRAGHATDVTLEQYRLVMAVNLDAPFLLSQAAIPHLLETGGSIVNVASNAGLQGVPYVLPYAVSKGGVVQLTRALAVEYLKTPLRVNAVAPAGTRTRLAGAIEFPDDIDADLAGRMFGHRGMSEPDEVAGLIAFLASDEARSVTGAVYTIDHGLTAS